MTTDLRFPVGRFTYEGPYTEAQRENYIREIGQTPAELRRAYKNLPDGGLDMPYRPGGWTARQVIHHVSESHMHSYLRFKFAVTESDPVIKVYDEAVWAAQPDAVSADPEVSLQLLEALHKQWIAFLRSLKPEDWQRAYRHPELGLVTLDRALGLYAWHGRHHAAHLGLIRKSAP